MTRTLRLAKDVSRRLAAGHPWVYREALAVPRGEPGEVVEVASQAGQPLARGWFDPDGAIAVRVLAAPGTRIDGDFIAERVVAAAGLRAAARARIDADGVRLLHGEGDRLPGLVFDFYAGVGVLRCDGDAAAAMWRPHAPTIAGACAAAGFPLTALVARGGRKGARAELLSGTLPDELTIREAAARYEVDVVHGQKTGFFLDQRDNRRLVGELAAGATVLNLFAYTGGFSVAAGLGGARAVTSVDSAAPAMAAAERNLRRNGLGAGHELVVEDAWRFLHGARDAGRTWDMVVCDPPSFAPSAKALAGALTAYRDLNRAVAAVVAPGGLLVTASCSSHVTPEAFQAAIADAVAQRPRARLLDVRGAGIDHPVLPAFPEGRYLKCLVLAL